MAFTKIAAAGIGSTETVTLHSLEVLNNATVGGVLTYEDVTNVDSVGIITARAGVLVGSGITLSKDGDGFFTGVTTATTFVGALTGNVTGNISGGTVAGSTGTFTGDVDIADKIVHTGDTDTAIRFSGADTITAETGGSERARIDSSGRLLIGATSQRTVWGGQQQLSIEGLDGATASASIVRNSNDAFYPFIALGKSRGTSDGSSTIVQDDDVIGILSFNAADGTDMTSQTAYIESAVDGTPGSNDTPGRLAFYTTADGASSSTERLRITSSGQMGLGMTPTRMFEVKDSTGANRVMNIRSTGTSGAYLAFLDANTTDDSKARIGSVGGDDIVVRGDSVQFSSGAGGEYGRFDSSGRLLVGTTSNTSHAVSSSNNPLLQLESTSSDDYGRASFIYNGNNGVGPGLWFAKSRGTSIGSNTIVNDGDQVGGLFFHVADGTDKHSRCAAIEVKIDGAPGANDTPGLIRFLTTPDGSAAAEEKVRIPGSTWGLLVTNQSSTGSTGGYQTEGVSLRYTGDSTFVKTDAAAVTMTRKGNAGKVLDFYSGTSYAGGVYVNGQNSAQYQSSSDYRLKDNVNSISDGISKVKQLNPIYYTNKQIGDVTDTSTVYNGFLAHEVQSVIPTLVDGEKDADVDERGKGYQTLNYAGFAPTAIAAIKELIAKVETLESKVAALEG